MAIAQLVDPQQLENWLQAADLVIIDCRFSLDDPAYGQRSYSSGHIPLARFADLDKDLSAPVIPGITGRHPLPDEQTLLNKLCQWGISNHSRIVLYDDGPGAFAARAWWLLAWLGKREDVYLLDGGLQAWNAAGLPLENDTPPVNPGAFRGQADNRLLLDAQTLEGRLGDTI